jgi:Xaa-Pro aminopeptidase
MANTASLNLKALRAQMRKAGIDAYIVPSSDPHQSEYTPAYWKCRSWLTGFLGSAGTAVVTQKEAGIWTDFRYFIQAAAELKGSGFTLFKMGEKDVPTWQDWIAKTLPEKATVGCFGQLLSMQTVRDLEKKLAPKQQKLNGANDLIAPIWTKGRPALPADIIALHDLKYAGKSRKEKLATVREKMKAKGADWYLISSLDDVAWLYNIRGNDIPYCPFVLSYALIGMKTATLFVDPAKVPAGVAKALKKDGIGISDYDEVAGTLKRLPTTAAVYLAPLRISQALNAAIPAKAKRIEGRDITTELKAVKNATEIENFRRHMVQDGVAMVKFLYWLEQEMKANRKVSEISAEVKLSALRAARPENCGDSFATIAGYADHAAMCHYKAAPESQYTLKKRGLFLVDSGGQYGGATTDITRTMAVGPLTVEEKTDYTLVLKGNINITMTRFLKGCTGTNLDILARIAMWQQRIDFKHGTGHGIGNFLSVHEGPQNLSQVWNDVAFAPGMLVTVEPGIYREGKHGIRLENVVLCAEEGESAFGSFLKFTPLTLCPFDLTPVIREMLTPAETAWLNEYHESVRRQITPFLTKVEAAWLRKATRAI